MISSGDVGSVRRPTFSFSLDHSFFSKHENKTVTRSSFPGLPTMPAFARRGVVPRLLLTAGYPRQLCLGCALLFARSFRAAMLRFAHACCACAVCCFPLCARFGFSSVPRRLAWRVLVWRVNAGSGTFESGFRGRVPPFCRLLWMTLDIIFRFKLSPATRSPACFFFRAPRCGAAAPSRVVRCGRPWRSRLGRALLFARFAPSCFAHACCACDV